MAKVEAAGTVFQAENSVCKGPGVQVSLPGVHVWTETGSRGEIMRLERSLETRFQAFLSAPRDTSVTVTHGKAAELNSWGKSRKCTKLNTFSPIFKTQILGI